MRDDPGTNDPTGIRTPRLIALLTLLAFGTGAAAVLDPEPPASFRAVPGFDGIYLEWTLSPTPNVVSYRIRRERLRDGRRVIVGTIPRPRVNMFDTSAVGGVAYAYQIQSTDWFGVNGPYSAPVEVTFRDSVPPAAPDSVSVTTSAGALFVDWKAGSEIDLDHYRVYRAVEGGEPARIGQAAFAGWLDSSAHTAVRYEYAVTSVDLSGNESPLSTRTPGFLPDAVAPARVTGFTAQPSPTGIALAWNPSPELDLAAYRIYRARTTTNPTLLSETDSGAATFLDTTAVERTFYIYRIRPLDHSGNEGEPAFAQTELPDLRAPAAPAGFTASRSGQTILLEWGASPEPDLAEYRLHHLNLVDSTSALLRLPPGVTRHQETPFGVGVPTQYWIAAADSSGNISASADTIETAAVTERFTPHVSRPASGEWTLVSVPGGDEFDIAATMPGADWDLLDPADGRPLATLRPGGTSWMRTSQDWTLAAVVVDQVAMGPLGFTWSRPVSPGWNYLGAPFDIPISWKRILVRNDASGQLLRYDASGWTSSAWLAPGDGYAWYNRAGLGSLEIPYIAADLPPAARPQEPAVRFVLSGTDWRRSAEVVLDPGATPEFDALDHPLPPDPFGRGDLRLRAGDHDYRTLSLPEPRSFTIHIRSNEPSVLSAEWPPDLDLAAYTFVAGDPGTGTPVSLDAPLPLLSGTHELLVIFPDFDTAAAPMERDLGPPWPNPFQDRLVVEFEVQRAGRVRIDAFDLLGRHIENILDADRSSGRHQIHWQPSPSIGSAAYLIRVTTPSGARTHIAHLIR